MESRTIDLGPRPRPVVARFVREDGTISVPYVIEGPHLTTPPGCTAVEIYQLPVYEADYPFADAPGWGNKPGDSAARPWPAPGAAIVTRVEVRGPDHFRKTR